MLSSKLGIKNLTIPKLFKKRLNLYTVNCFHIRHHFQEIYHFYPVILYQKFMLFVSSHLTDKVRRICSPWKYFPLIFFLYLYENILLFGLVVSSQFALSPISSLSTWYAFVCLTVNHTRNQLQKNGLCSWRINKLLKSPVLGNWNWF